MADGSVVELERAELKVSILEQMVAEKMREVYFANEILRANNARLAEIYRVMPSALLVIAPDFTVAQVNPATLQLLGYDEDILTGTPVERVWPRAADFCKETGTYGENKNPRREEQWMTRDHKAVELLVSSGFVDDAVDGERRSIICVGVNLAERKKAEVETRHAQKLESIGQLAAGIAHEINTPMQFVGDNAQFLKDVFADVIGLVEVYEKTVGAQPELYNLPELVAARERADLDYVRDRVPRASERLLGGVARVNRIVSAMKSFAHPDQALSFFDVNVAIENTLVVAANELKYVADVKTELGELPHAYGNAGDLGQVVLNLVVNAAHAIEYAERGRGLITIATRVDGEFVLIDVTDTGTGIPHSLRSRIFEPFFTTKPVGKGTGQGLALAYSLVVKKSGGQLSFDTELTKGTTFHVRIPLRADKKE